MDGCFGTPIRGEVLKGSPSMGWETAPLSRAGSLHALLLSLVVLNITGKTRDSYRMERNGTEQKRMEIE